MKHIRALFLMVFLTPAVSFACINDTDCAVGSRCIKPSTGSFYGLCAGGNSPGNSNDQSPVSDVQDPVGTYGNTCVVNTDCSSVQMCLKEGGNREGVCVRR